MNLVVQGPGLTPQLAQEALLLLKKKNFEPINDRAIRVRGVAKGTSVAEWCVQRKLDCAWMPEGLRFADLRLLAMDMDSTLITIECIDELGDLAGKGAEVAAITAGAMRGEFDYPESLRRRVGLLAGLQEAALGRVYEERLRLTPGAEKLVEACKAAGVKLLLVSGGFAFFTEKLRHRLGLDYTISNELEVSNGRLTGKLLGKLVDAEAKADKFRAVAKTLKAERRQTVAIGDGANDLKMMAEAGVSIAFRAKPVVQARATCAINWSGLDGVLNLFD